MLNIAGGSYTMGAVTTLPLPIIKNISILPTEMEEGQNKTVNIVVDIMLQKLSEGNPWGRCNLHLIAFKSATLANRVKKNTSQLRRILASTAVVGSNYDIVHMTVSEEKDNASSVMYNEAEILNATYQVRRVPLKVEYVDENIDYLCVMVVTSQITGGGTENRGSQPKESNSHFHISTPAIETVLSRALSPLMTNVFKLKETVKGYGAKGEVWSAPVHRHPIKGLMAGSSHAGSTHPTLETVKLPNLKIKDYRVAAINNVASSPQPPATDLKMYISELYYSRSKDNTVKMFFSFDMLKYMIDNSSLSYLFLDKNSLQSTAQISDVLIYRQRTNKQSMGNRLTPQLDDPFNKCTTSPKKLVASLSAGTVRIVKAMASPLPGVYEMVASDNSMADEGESTFKYTMEIEILDQSAPVLARLLRRLEIRMSRFDEYMLQMSNFNKKGYDVDTYMSLGLKANNNNSAWSSLLLEYLSTVLFLRGSHLPYGFTIKYIMKNLIAMASPSSATSKSLLIFRSQVNDFISFLTGALNKGTLGTGDTVSDTERSKIGASSAVARRITYYPSIKDPYINDLDYEVGFDYMGDSLQDSATRLGLISVQNFVSRISKEVAKYQTPGPNATNINKFGFLSPDVIKTPKNPIQVKREMPLDQSLNLLQANSSAISRMKSFTGNPSHGSNKRLDIDSLLSLEGVSYEKNKESLKNIVVGSGDQMTDVDSAQYFSSTSHFVSDDDYTQPEATGDATPRYRFFFNKLDKFIDSPVIQRIVDRGAERFKKASPTNLQNIEGSLAFAELNLSQENLNTMNSFEKNLIFNSVVRIEYFAGYKTGVKDPRWLLADAALLGRLREDKSSALCRLSMPNRSLNVENRYELSKYDSLFVLGDTPLTQLMQPGPAAHYLYLLESTTQRMKKINPKAAGGTLQAQYTCADMMIYDAPRSSGKNISRVKKAMTERRSTGPTKGGNY